MVDCDTESTTPAVSMEPIHLTPEEVAVLFQAHKDKLTPTTREIISLHYGLEDGHINTLEEIMAKAQLTRRNILPMERRGLRRLQRLAIRDASTATR